MKHFVTFTAAFLLISGCSPNPNDNCSSNSGLNSLAGTSLHGVEYLSSTQASVGGSVFYGGLLEGTRKRRNERYLCQAIIQLMEPNTSSSQAPSSQVGAKVRVYTSRKCLRPQKNDKASLYFYLYSDSNASNPSLKKAGYIAIDFESDDLEKLGQMRSMIQSSGKSSALRYIENYSEHYIIRNILSQKQNTSFNEYVYKSACSPGVNFERGDNFNKWNNVLKDLEDNQKRHFHCYLPSDLTMLKGSIGGDATRRSLLNSRGKAFRIQTETKYPEWSAHLERKFQDYDLALIKDFHHGTPNNADAPRIYADTPDWQSLKDYTQELTRLWENIPLTMPQQGASESAWKSNEDTYVFSNNLAQDATREKHGFEIISLVRDKANQFGVAFIRSPFSLMLAGKSNLAVLQLGGTNAQSSLARAQARNNAQSTGMYRHSILMLGNQPLATLASVNAQEVDMYAMWDSLVHVHNDFSATSTPEPGNPSNPPSNPDDPKDNPGTTPTPDPDPGVGDPTEPEPTPGPVDTDPTPAPAPTPPGRVSTPAPPIQQQAPKPIFVGNTGLTTTEPPIALGDTTVTSSGYTTLTTSITTETQTGYTGSPVTPLTRTKGSSDGINAQCKTNN